MFLTREPVLHQLGGSTTYALGLLHLLVRNGAEVTLVTTTAASRSARLWFTLKSDVPRGVRFVAPGMWRFGRLYVGPFSPKAWARFLVRLAVRLPLLSPFSRMLESIFGERLVSVAWDLTPPTPQERAVAARFVEAADATTVIANYAFWGPAFDDAVFAGRRSVVLMHDLLSARVTKFLAAGLPLDCPAIDETTEIAWLDHADCLLAAQAREAEIVQPQVKSKVVVMPMVFTPQPSRGRVDAKRCLFVGSNIVPNQTGLTWFLESVWPLVRAQDAEAKLAVVGSICASVTTPPAGVDLLGIVPSIEQEYARAAVCVIPLLVGSGIKIKLLEALSYGKATVSTAIGVQGVEEWAPGAVAVTDDPTAFATAVLRLMQDPTERERAQQAGLALAEKYFGAETALPNDFVDCVLGPN